MSPTAARFPECQRLRLAMALRFCQDRRHDIWRKVLQPGVFQKKPSRHDKSGREMRAAFIAFLGECGG